MKFFSLGLEECGGLLTRTSSLIPKQAFRMHHGRGREVAPFKLMKLDESLNVDILTRCPAMKRGFCFPAASLPLMLSP